MAFLQKIRLPEVTCFPDRCQIHCEVFGPSAAARLLDRIAEVDAPLRALSEFRPPAATVEHWQEFEATISTLRLNAAGWPADLDVVCRWYRPQLERKYDDAVVREADLEQLAQLASNYPSR